ncbi:hypothetical protein E2C01_084474 [Portunus trituberculatus]|uniref:Uncharacterized protein n=1 Tax=Portunus trituberculatus TaxID=210409 RepID=A0A5B7J4X5_PORTR|nr:hypothetical protein [Portunus trituberculatus]
MDDVSTRTIRSVNTPRRPVLVSCFLKSAHPQKMPIGGLNSASELAQRRPTREVLITSGCPLLTGLARRQTGINVV